MNVEPINAEEEEYPVSDTLYVDLPSSGDDSSSNQHYPLSSVGYHLTPTGHPFLLTSITASSDSVTRPSITRKGGDNSVLGNMLSSDDEEAVVTSDLDSMVNLANLENRGLPEFRIADLKPFEKETEHNVLNRVPDGEISSGLEKTMKNINELFKGEGSIDFKQLSLNEIKSVFNNLNENHDSNKLSNKSAYSSVSQDEEMVV